MTIKEYTTAAQRFAADTANFGGLDPYTFYTTDGNLWRETCDNAHGGLDVSWAFHEDAETIAAEAPQRYADQIADRLEQAIDEGSDPDFLAAVLDLLR